MRSMPHLPKRRRAHERRSPGRPEGGAVNDMERAQPANDRHPLPREGGWGNGMSHRPPRILLIGTADTKSDELLFLRGRIEAGGGEVSTCNSTRDESAITTPIPVMPDDRGRCDPQ